MNNKWYRVWYLVVFISQLWFNPSWNMRETSQYRYRRKKCIHPLSHRSFAREWNQTPVFAGFLRESRRREILHRPRLRLFILNLPRREVEIVARVYRAIFDPFLHRRLTIRRCPLLSPIHPRRNSLQQHSRPSPSIIYHFETSKMLLSTSVLEKFHPQSSQSQTQAPGS